jgi:hypothetical protein
MKVSTKNHIILARKFRGEFDRDPFKDAILDGKKYRYANIFFENSKMLDFF